MKIWGKSKKKNADFLIFTNFAEVMSQLDVILNPIKSEFEHFQQMFSHFVDTDNPLLLDVLRHVVQRKGKQMRPILTLLFARLYGNVSDATYNSALSLELLHTASLIHDDVVDESTERRGLPSVPALFGSKVSVLSGDFLLATSLSYMSLIENMEMARVVSRLAQELADGELLQQHFSFSDSVTEEIYFSIIKKKTASLFSACARLGAMSAEASNEEIEKSARFGELVGLCFQIRDDIFDYFDSSEIGKPTGNDIREGKQTLPLLYALKQHGNAEIMQLVHQLGEAEITDEKAKKLTSFAIENGGIEYAEKVMDELRQQALDILPKEGDAEVLEALRAYLTAVVTRTK